MIGKQFNMGNDFKQRKNNKSFQKKDNYKSFKNDDKHKFNSEDFPETSNNATDNLIIGRNPVLEALKAEKLIDTIYVNSEATGSIAHIISLAREQGIVIKNVNDTKLSQ